MARDYKILATDNSKWMFIDKNSRYPQGYISYRHVLVHNIHNLLWNVKLEEKEVQILFASFKQSWDAKADAEEPTFMDSHISTRNITIIDHSKGCYPLCLDHQVRINAFNHAIEDIYKSLVEIFLILFQYEIWSPELQNKLEVIYSMP